MIEDKIEILGKCLWIIIKVFEKNLSKFLITELYVTLYTLYCDFYYFGILNIIIIYFCEFVKILEQYSKYSTSISIYLRYKSFGAIKIHIYIYIYKGERNIT